MQTIYLVKEIKGWNYEGSDESIVFSSFDKEQAIDFAKSHFIEEEISLNISSDYSNVIVDSINIGKVETEVTVWSARRNMSFVTPEEAIEITAKPTLAILVNPSLLVDLDNRDINWFIQYQPRTKITEQNISKVILQKQAEVANDMEWDLFERYEKVI